MTAIITGDIVNSRDVSPTVWLPALKNILAEYGKTPKQWEIFRGDSFQIEVSTQDALKLAFDLKSAIKQMGDIDIKIAIGIGVKTYEAKKITEANGEAFINSGECFENLKKATMGIKTPWNDFDATINLMLELALLTVDTWTTTSAEIIKIAMQNPESSQNDLAKILSKSQSNVSAGMKRGGYDEILKLMKYYENQVNIKLKAYE
jgi:hypothetical protein